MGIFQNGEKWVLSIALKRVLGGLAGYFVTLLINGMLYAKLQSFGVSIDPAVAKDALVGVGVAGGIALHDWIRTKTGWSWI